MTAATQTHNNQSSFQRIPQNLGNPFLYIIHLNLILKKILKSVTVNINAKAILVVC